MTEFTRAGMLHIEPDAPGQVDPLFQAAPANEADVLAGIRKCYERYGYVIDPHTSCGYSVATSLVPVPGGGPGGSADRDEPTICIATAHPAKFPAAIERATGQDLDGAHHPIIDALADLPTRCTDLPNDAEAVGEFIKSKVG